jgi:hypothetical protein
MNRFTRHFEEEDSIGGVKKRKRERVDTNVKVKPPGDSARTECTTSNVRTGSFCFDTAQQLTVEDPVTLQVMLQSKTETRANVHFLASSRVIRIIPKDDKFQTPVEFIADVAVREEILRLLKVIKSQNLKIERPKTLDAVLYKKKAE